MKMVHAYNGYFKELFIPLYQPLLNAFFAYPAQEWMCIKIFSQCCKVLKQDEEVGALV